MNASARRPPRPDDLYRIRIPTAPRISPDGRLVAFVVQSVAAGFDGYRHAIWAVAADGSSGPRQLTIGAKHDTHPRFSPDGRRLAFLSDRRTLVEDDPTAPKDREDGVQVHLLDLDGGEARRLTDLPRGVDEFAWSPDGRTLVVSTSSHAATREEDLKVRGRNGTKKPGEPPESDYRYLDRLRYQSNGPGFSHHRVNHLWLVDVATGAAKRLTALRAGESAPAWSPDGTRVAFEGQWGRDHDVAWRTDIGVVEASSGAVARVTRGPGSGFFAPTWLPDGLTLAVLGGRLPENAYRSDVWLFAADGSEADRGGGRNLSGQHDLMPGDGIGSDITPGEAARLAPSADGAWITLTAPADGSYELFRISTADSRLERLTDDRHFISSFDQVGTAGGGSRIVSVRSTPTETPDLEALEVGRRAKPRRLTSLNAELLGELELREPVERRSTVDGRQIQGWLIPAGPGRQPLVTEIHGGPHTLYGWAPVWEFQILAASGMSVFYCNPRGSDGYGRAFNEANLRDWGPGPTRDVLAGIDGLVADGLADPERLGLTGGSYGGYLTNWIVAHDQRFRAAITCRSVADVGMLMLTGDISSGDWSRFEFGRTPWQDPAFFREISPITYADGIRTPLLIQHSERDLRTTIGQAEALFTVLRSLRRPVRLMRVPEETHELTRSGTPFRRVENLVQVRDWFAHFLVKGRRRLPPLPKARAGK